MTAPKVSTETYLNAIACVSVKNCVAVGIDSSTGDSRSIIEQWNGTKWSVASTPSVSGSVEDQLSSVSCVSGSSCIAVGGAYNGSWHPLIQRWNGKRWSLIASPALGGLNGVSCVAPPACTAVGGGSKQIIEQTTDGDHWKSVTPPAAGAATAVACLSSSSCYAVANLKSGQSSNNPPVFEYSNGSHWAYMQMPVRSGHPNVLLSGLSCTSPTNCVAVGNDGATLAEHFDGKAWTIEHTQSPGANNYLSGVACPTAARCTAVGSWRNTGNTNTLVENRTS